MKFIHAADIHLDSPLRGLASYEGAPVEEIRNASRRALDNLVELAIENKVDFVLIAGDLYDGDWRDHNTGLFFARQMSELRKADIPAFVIAGNHDAQNVMTKHLPLPDNVRQFGTRKPETFRLEDLGVAIHGQGFPTKAVTDDLTLNYPPVVPGLFNIGLLHTSLTGREGHDNYAPCTVDGLNRLGYDYWALGHVHTRECVQADPPIWFPGNIQGRHIRETGPKGCLMVTVDGSGKPGVEFHELDVLRWEDLIIDATEFRTDVDCTDEFQRRLSISLENAGGRTVALRVSIGGASAIHEALAARPDDFRAAVHTVANDYGGGRVWVEKVKVLTRPVADTPATDTTDAMSELLRVVESLAADEAALLELAGEFEPLASKLPPEFRDGADALPFMDTKYLAEVLGQVYPMLNARLRRVEAQS